MYIFIKHLKMQHLMYTIQNLFRNLMNHLCYILHALN